MVTKAELPLMVIQWNDHNSEDDWLDAERARDHAKPAVISTVGWLQHETDDIYSLASTYSHDDGQVSMIMNIVKSAVVSATVLTEPKKRKRRSK